jgi:cation:H+ antiporter
VIEINNIKKTIKEDKEKNIKDKNILISVILIIVGILGLKFGGDIVVNEATKMAIKYKISESVIGLTIVALGTSLPELITSIVAIIKKKMN